MSEKDEEKPDALESNSPYPAKPNLKGDWMNINLLLLLYMFQGIPLGFSDAIPLILQNQKNVSYHDQAVFSISHWPFSLKLLWAPIVDSLFITKIGRRKSWLLPVQYLLDNWMYKENKPQVNMLAFIFVVLNFLAATQDIAVDGWALSLLKKENVGYASMCNSTGQAIGVFLGYIVPILLDSERFCNNFLRSTPSKGGVVSMKSFFYFWGIAFIVVTSLVGILKKENKKLPSKSVDGKIDGEKFNVLQTYVMLWDIMKISGVRTLALALLTYKIGFVATANVTNLKLMSAGLPKDDLLIVITALYPVKVIIPLVVSKFTSGPKPMSALLNVFPFRLLLGFVAALLVYYTPILIKKGGNGEIIIPFEYYVYLGIFVFVFEVVVYFMLVAMLAFFSRISDPLIGGTYMTLLNTVSNLGTSWTTTLSLSVVEWLTFKSCTSNLKNNCSSNNHIEECKLDGQSCTIFLDGYYLEIAICLVLGTMWYVYYNKKLRNLQKKSEDHWTVK
ncbi:acetyl-coenzyme A transporter 1-like isoform X2 [Daktulosphaira vitifoliae]|uniref:acetyl-coenzyme A transporter 1-like isoform X2 n=1 Tax=Daktulosphaira vitifoliae TaxID=58002 RepID=UPI0021AA7759|nr:acetyl-coenzyme A transporter 1-like isoform X2 [Daktulosphaira vitifoliae]